MIPIKRYLPAFLRHLKKHWYLTLLNVSGYGLGLAACLLLIQHIRYETSFDTHYEDHEKIYRVVIDHYLSDVYENATANSFYSLGAELQKRYPEITSYTIVKKRDSDAIVTVDGRSFLQKNLALMDTNYFKVFKPKLLSGNTDQLKILDAFITPQIANKYFGTNDPIGKTIKMAWVTLTVRGVLKDPPVHSHLTFDILYVTGQRKEYINDWTECLVHTYIKLNGEADLFQDKLNHFSEDLSPLAARQSKLERSFKARLQPLADIHLNSHLESEHEVNGSTTNIYILGILTGMILLISCFNYASLSDTINFSRSTEMFVKKVHGASFRHLVPQYLIEAFMLNVLGFALATLFIVGYVEWLTPLLNAQTIWFSWTDPFLYLPATILFVLATLLFGLLPFLLPSRQTLLSAPKGQEEVSKNELSLSKHMATAQFFIAYLLLSGAFAVSAQIRLLHEADAGFDHTNALALNIMLLPFHGHETILDRLEHELLSEPAIQHVAYSYTIPGDHRVLDTSIALADNLTEKASNAFFQTVSPGYFDTFGIRILKGRIFSDDRQADSLCVLVNETLARKLTANKQDITGQAVVMDYFGTRTKLTVLGVVKDYHHSSIKEAISPMLYLPVRYYGAVTKISIKVNHQETENFQTAARLLPLLFEKNLGTRYEASGLGMAHELQDVSFIYGLRYKSDRQFVFMVRNMAFLAMVMTGIGFLGLAAKTAKRRMKEVAIRKVNGASTRSLLTLLAAHFLKVAGLAFLLSLPFSYLLVQNWLEGFPVRINIGFWFVTWPLLITMILMGLSISYPLAKVVLLNPVRVLRSE